MTGNKCLLQLRSVNVTRGLGAVAQGDSSKQKGEGGREDEYLSKVIPLRSATVTRKHSKFDNEHQCPNSWSRHHSTSQFVDMSCFV